MRMKKKFILVLVAVNLLIIAGLVYWQVGKNQGSILGMFKIGQKTTTINWDNPDEVFNIRIPDDFDANKSERLGEKIIAAKDLYATKKDETWTWIVIGNMYQFALDFDRAIGAYEKSTSLNEGEYISRTNLAYIYENEKKDYAKAEEYYKKVVELNGANPFQHINLARLYEFKMNKTEDAEKVYLAGLEITSNNPDLLVAVIRFYQRANKADKVAEYAGQLLKLYPDNELYKNDFGSLVEKK